MSSTRAHEPPGLTVISPGIWNALPVKDGHEPAVVGKGWTSPNPGSLTLLTDPVAGPYLHTRFPPGLKGGTSPYHVNLAWKPISTFYQSIGIRIPQPWSNGGNSGTKFQYLWTTPTNHSYTSLFAGNPGAANYGKMALNIQSPSCSGTTCGGLKGGQLYFGSFNWNTAAPGFHWFESLYTLGSAATFWVDGVQVASKTGMLWAGASIPQTGWSWTSIQPTYGGGTHSPPMSLYLDFTQPYISGK